MRPFTPLVSVVVPGFVGLVLVLLAAMPFGSIGFDVTPNIAWLMTLTIISLAPRAWPLGLAFILGLMQDVLFATPLGAQAFIAVMLHWGASARAARGSSVFFRVRWLEASLWLLAAHAVLLLLTAIASPGNLNSGQVLRAGLVSAAWYPLFYGILRAIFCPHREEA